jgi:hypothetical protein
MATRHTIGDLDGYVQRIVGLTAQPLRHFTSMQVGTLKQDWDGNPAIPRVIANRTTIKTDHAGRQNPPPEAISGRLKPLK